LFQKEDDDNNNVHCHHCFFLFSLF
jgi:hypothetical protein